MYYRLYSRAISQQLIFFEQFFNDSQICYESAAELTEWNADKNTSLLCTSVVMCMFAFKQHRETLNVKYFQLFALSEF